MEALRLGKSVRRITVLERDAASGEFAPVVMFKKKSKKRKTSRAMRPVEKVIRRLVDAQAQSADRYVTRHNKSNRKRRDGWVRDLNANVVRASRKGAKRLRMNRWLDF